jgi:hypothetical protein
MKRIKLFKTERQWRKKATSKSSFRSVCKVSVTQSDGGACYTSLVLQLVSKHFHAYHRYYSLLEDDAY